ncbi:SDR family oxidoreductase [Achromobacter denitrificans]|jgi:3-hydroxybutyrate dehydrogenase|uniref:SDR family NAD(P)-dependent oxidoreductase n=2 Tax=Achromobacter denitrificans TaxID=32002 RepID=A0A3R9H2F8_ACHDE|nr:MULTISPECIES: SDR family NAD(P)-dependent oxidoreductase [Achromobacter]ASC64169.1 NAD(P)-dependent oxidoreductase [Achromobacter denitrificans]MBV2157765.1 SDR family oxidoreductase [Achromobacter denitrificans]MDF3846708.1 SDR family NAD(P)-dependent oxidoreductase [Achromobacter denitrificans]MDF3856948.1 SDR family NAD(P)-dependent oxidoreductase [Achromobacter denitrificans]MDF3943501.1 SDR family NAD(P)-dependent oxidoreductase [Achromobacter denitrificans]
MNPTPLPLAGRHALVTGGARGIGLACARALLQRGARVTLLGRDGAALDAATDSLARLGQVQAVSADIADEASVRAAFAQAEVEFGPVQVLVNNAGQAVSERFDRTDSALWQSMIAVNLTGTFNCIQAALPGMLKEKWGRVINVASTAGLIGYGYVSAYCAAKHGVVGLTRSLALEVALKGVTVNAVCPGYTETDIVRGAVSNIVDKTGMSPEAARAKLAERNPQGRLIQPEEVAETVAWLALPASASVNGQAIAVDGGEVMTG